MDGKGQGGWSSDSEAEEKEDVVLKALSAYITELDDEQESGRLLLERVNNNCCLICLSSIKKIDAVWSCGSCYTLFHLMCIQQWAKDGVERNWTCPQCRTNYSKNNVPTLYRCYCEKQIDPVVDPWLLAHSCGNVCGRDLKSYCGHKCLSLCHPGPCPPCPKSVVSSCHCGNSPPRAQRCGSTGWSCNKVCARILSCGLHTCEQICHEGLCNPCPEKVLQSCMCGKGEREQPCDQPRWSCGQICDKQLSCHHHHCQQTCHSGDCGICPRIGKRSCPCGKKSYDSVDCTTDVPCCGDTCAKELNCGRHQCVRMCHFGDCGPCLQSYEKRCRCGQKKKSLPCHQTFLCDSKCQRSKQCGRHQCRRKCCAGDCLPCEQLCGRLLHCRNHKCSSPCHSGRCYPCVMSESISCACGKTTISVPCGRKRTSKPPQCTKPCSLPPVCHHSQAHHCHFGKCPPCKQVCSLPLPCDHLCLAPCHLQPVHQPQEKPVAPWEKVEPVLVVRPCPPCRQLVPKACHGGHEVQKLPCSEVVDYSCGRKCGRRLKCGNHTCQRPCHTVSEDCYACEEPCGKSRHPGCKHLCPLPCHPGTCPPCESTVKFPCHCSAISVYIKCSDWCDADAKSQDEKRTCSGRCSKMLQCGHWCPKKCHPGSCISIEQCQRKVTVRCKCNRLKKDWKCNEQKIVTCNEECLSIQQKQQMAAIIAANTVAAQKDQEEAAAIARIERQLRPRKRKKQKVQEDFRDLSQNKNLFKFSLLGVTILCAFLFFFYIIIWT